MNKIKKLSIRVGIVALAGAAVFAAHQQEAQAWVAGKSFYEECNIDFHVSGVDPDLLSCNHEEVQETYRNGSYKEECYGEGCNTEERYELSEGRGSNYKTERVHNYMLNTFCFGRDGANDKGFKRGVYPGHFKTIPAGVFGGIGNVFCLDFNSIACNTLNQFIPGVCGM